MLFLIHVVMLGEKLRPHSLEKWNFVFFICMRRTLMFMLVFHWCTVFKYTALILFLSHKKIQQNEMHKTMFQVNIWLSWTLQ